jgi:hypothetical protein
MDCSIAPRQEVDSRAIEAPRLKFSRLTEIFGQRKMSQSPLTGNAETGSPRNRTFDWADRVVQSTFPEKTMALPSADPWLQRIAEIG